MKLAVLFWCGVGGDGGGVPDIPVFLFIVVTNVCDIVMGCVLSVVVCSDVDVADWGFFEVSIGTVLACWIFLVCCIFWSFCAFAGKESISCNVQFNKCGYSLPVWSNTGMK